MGPRAMPSHVPSIPMVFGRCQRSQKFLKLEKTFLSVFAGNDPVTNGVEKDVLRMCPNAESTPHIGGGHFYQWTRPKELSNLLTNLLKNKIVEEKLNKCFSSMVLFFLVQTIAN